MNTDLPPLGQPATTSSVPARAHSYCLPTVFCFHSMIHTLVTVFREGYVHNSSRVREQAANWNHSLSSLLLRGLYVMNDCRLWHTAGTATTPPPFTPPPPKRNFESYLKWMPFQFYGLKGPGSNPGRRYIYVLPNVRTDTAPPPPFQVLNSMGTGVLSRA